MKMTIHIIFNDCPAEFGDKSILAVYSNKKHARKKMAAMLKWHPYENQYITLITKRVFTVRKRK